MFHFLSGIESWTEKKKEVDPFGGEINYLTPTTLNYFWKVISWRIKVFFQFEIIITVLVSSSLFTWIPMLGVYDHYKYSNSFSRGDRLYSQNLTSTESRPEALVQWLKMPAWKWDIAGSLVKIQYFEEPPGPSGRQCHLIHLIILRTFSWPSSAYMCTKVAWNLIH